MITTKSNPAAFPSSLRQLKTSLVKNRGDVEKKKVFVRLAHGAAKRKDWVMLTTRHRFVSNRSTRLAKSVAPSRCRSRRCSCGLQVRALLKQVGNLEGPPFSTDTSPRFLLCCRRRRRR